MKDEIIKKTSGMQAMDVENLSADYKKLGVLFRKQLEKLTIFRNSGPWTSIAFKYQNLVGGEWDSPRVMLAFFKSMDGMFKRYSYFNVRNKEEAIKIVKFLISSFDIDKKIFKLISALRGSNEKTVL